MNNNNNLQGPASLNGGMMWNMPGSEKNEVSWEHWNRPNNNSHNIASGNTANGNVGLENSTGSVDVRSFQEMLMESLGKFVVCRFLLGTGALANATGILKNVGRDYFVLEDPCTRMVTTCDLYSVKFISVLPDDFIPNIPSYCRRRLYENTPLFETGI